VVLKTFFSVHEKFTDDNSFLVTFIAYAARPVTTSRWAQGRFYCIANWTF